MQLLVTIDIGEVEAPPIGTGYITRAYGEYLRDFIKQYGCIHDQSQSSLQRHTHKFTDKDRHTLRHAHSRRETRIRLRPRITHTKYTLTPTYTHTQTHTQTQTYTLKRHRPPDR